MKRAGRFLAEERGIYELDMPIEVIEIPKLTPPPSTLAERLSDTDLVMMYEFQRTLPSFPVE